MTAFDKLLKGGESGAEAIVPGKPDESNLLDLITPDDGKAEMPKDKPPLADQRDRPDPPVDRAGGRATTPPPTPGSGTTWIIRPSTRGRR